MAQLGKTVFLNAASCVRVRHGSVAALQNEAEFDAVDDIRIQPQNEPMLQVRQGVGVLEFRVQGVVLGVYSK